MRLEARDRQVLAETFLSKVIRRDDLISFGYFTSVPRCNARLLALREEGLLKARTELGGMELRATLYHCTAKGVRIAAEELDMSADEAIEIHRAGIRELAIKHALRCSDLRRHFSGCSSSTFRLENWSQELLCHHEFQVNAKTVVVKPDALAVLDVSGQKRHVFVEVDLGNAALPKIREKLSRYLVYDGSGAFAEAYTANTFSVLSVTTDERRLAHLRVLSTLSSFYFTTWKRIGAEGVGGAIYTTAAGDHVSLGELLR